MSDLFLQKVGVANSKDAMRNSLRAALQRNSIYKNNISSGDRKTFRLAWAQIIVKQVQCYSCPVTDKCHCEIIEKIAEAMTNEFESILVGERLRFGTSQKAFNLYLKFQWRLGMIPPPPHCPIDSVVLRIARLRGSWTKCDSVDEYMGWIEGLRKIALQVSLAAWEYDKWNQNP